MENQYKEKQAQLQEDVARIELITSWLDNKFRIPGTNFRFGIDPIVNLIPYLGDLIGFAMSLSMVMLMSRYGVSSKVVVKMLLNVFIDTIIGAIPLLGKIGDFFFKANEKNFKLLKDHYFEGKHNGSGMGIIVTVLLVFVGLMFVVFFFLYQLAAWCYEYLQTLT